MKNIFLTILLLTYASQAYSDSLKNSSTFFSADILAWRVREGSGENWAQSITTPGTNQTARLFDAPFKWNLGFRVGVGRSTLSGFDTRFYWTNYKSKATNSASGRLYSAFIGNFFANNTNGANFGPYYANASLLWRFSYDTIDIQFGHEFEVDSVLRLHPFIGLKSAFINQTINTNWQTPSTTSSGIPVPITTFSVASETLKNDFWGIGPSLGLDTTWPIYKASRTSLNLVGSFMSAILYGHWNFKDYYQNNTPVNITVAVNEVNSAAPMTAAFLGLEWGYERPQSSFNIRLGYEAQVWFKQMQYYSYNMGRLDNLMSLQGGTLSLAYKC